MFDQDPPELSNSYRRDGLLRAYLDRNLEADRRESAAEPLAELGDIATGSLFQLQLETLDEEPELVRVSPWGKRVDRIKDTEVWQKGRELAVDYEMVSLPYGRSRDPADRIEQFARVYLFAPSSDTYTCPLAMTDGAARTLLDSGNDELIDEAVSHLISSDEDNFWTSGQWMTEATGGSDVSRSRTVARRTEDGGWELHGRKWFTSAIGSEMALTLAKIEDADDDELTLFYVRTREDDGTPRQFRIERLKDKLGTRELPTGEIVLEGTPATPVKDLGNGVKNIFPMLSVTRTWNAVCSAAAMRRGLDLAESYAEKREVFGGSLAEKPLHGRVMERLEAETQGAFLLVFKAAELLGSDETELLRTLVPLAKLYTAKQAVTVSSEVIEVFGGAGYVEDTGLPKLLRDTQVLPIWEGTTNVLSLEVLRQLSDEAARERLRQETSRLHEQCATDEATELAGGARDSLDEVLTYFESNLDNPEELEASARSLNFRLGRTVETLLLCVQADWNRRNDRSTESLRSARILLETMNTPQSFPASVPLGT